MFIHIGNDHVIRSRDIVTIITFDMIESSIIMENLMEQMGSDNKIKGNFEDAKSIIVTVNQIYYCSLSVTTLKKRSSIRTMLQKFKDYSDDL